MWQKFSTLHSTWFCHDIVTVPYTVLPCRQWLSMNSKPFLVTLTSTVKSLFRQHPDCTWLYSDSNNKQLLAADYLLHCFRTVLIQWRHSTATVSSFVSQLMPPYSQRHVVLLYVLRHGRMCRRLPWTISVILIATETLHNISHCIFLDLLSFHSFLFVTVCIT